jgi:tetratricopeptide (TPR) repeat protein
MSLPKRIAAAFVLAALLAPPALSATDPLPDSLVIESPPAPLIVTPHAPATEAAPAPEDTAVAHAKLRAREAFGRGLLLEQQKAYSAAIISYVNAARGDPTLKGPSLRIGLLFASRQQWDPAARAFREELRRDPGNPAATREYATVLAELGDTTRAVRMLEDLSRRHPGDETVWRALGNVYLRTGRLESAEKALRGAVAMDRRYVLAWRDLGVLLSLRGHPEEAREAYRRARELDPDDPTITTNLANLESRLGRHREALALYHALEQRDSSTAVAYRGQIAELVALGREGEAGDVWRRWLAVDPGDLGIRESTARHYVRQQRGDVALAVAREGVRRSPRSGRAWWLLGEVRALTGDALGAWEAYQEAADRMSDPAELERNAESLRALRDSVPDSLRAAFAADSASRAARGARETPAPPRR